MLARALVISTLAVACGASPGTDAGGPQRAGGPCAGTVSGSFTGTFSCNHDASVIAAYDDSNGVSDVFIIATGTDVSRGMHLVEFQTESVGDLVAHSFDAGELSSFDVRVATNGLYPYRAVKSPVLLDGGIPNAGTVALTLASVDFLGATDAGESSYAIHGSADATLVLWNSRASAPFPDGGSVTMHVDF